MLRLLKWILISTLSLLLLLAAALAVAVQIIDPNDYKDEIAEHVEHEIGRELAIEGDIHYSLFPWLGFEIGRFTLADEDQYTDDPFLEVDRIEVAIRVLPLIRGQLEARAVEVTRPIVRLNRDESGVGNWESLAADARRGHGAVSAVNGVLSAAPVMTEPFSRILASGPIAAATAGTEGDLAELLEFVERVDVEGVHIHDGALFWNDRQADQSTAVESIDVNIDPLRADETVSLAARATVGGLERIELQADARLDTVSPVPRLHGGWQLAEFNPKDLVEAADLDPLQTEDETALTRLSGSGRIEATSEEIQLAELLLEVDDSRAEGSLAFAAEPPTIDMDLHLDEMDIDRYLPPADTEETQDTAASNGDDQAVEADADKDAPALPDLKAIELDLPLELLRELDLDGQIGFDHVQIAGLSTRDFAAELGSDNGMVGATRLTADLYEGELDGHAKLDARADEPGIDVHVDLLEVTFAPLTEDLLGRDWLHGSGTLRLQGKGRGANAHALVEDFEGSGELALLEGSLLGLDIGHELRNALADLRDEAQPEGEPERTIFAEMTATYDIGNGVVTNDDLLLTSPVFEANGAGEANILEESLDYRVEAAPDEGLERQDAELLHHLAGVTVPIDIQGQLLGPEIRVDLVGALSEEQRARIEGLEEQLDEAVEEQRDRLEDEAGEQLEEARDRLRDAL